MKNFNKKHLLITLAVGIFAGVFLFAVFDSPNIASSKGKPNSDSSNATPPQTSGVAQYTLPEISKNGSDNSAEETGFDKSSLSGDREEKTAKATKSTAKSTKGTAAEKTKKGDFKGVVNINTADVTELQKLKGVGEVISQRIVDYRETHGGFDTIEELMQVKGIGEKRFADIKDNICV